MRTGLLMLGVLLIPGLSGAQTRGNASADVDAAVAQMMAYDKNKDGKLTRAEITDERMRGMFDTADTNHDGILTKQELTAFFTSEFSRGPGRGPGGPGRTGGPGGPGF